ncbi:MAG: thiamine-phosphate kinase [Shewanellaceae bacterium]|nr:thiamine-phosphate kinase [Shewanellaceae bacterium]
MQENEIIERYFVKNRQRHDVLLPIGDDCAVVKPTPDTEIAISCDTMIEGVHFLSDAPAAAIAHKLVASNLSDLAAMGAEPAWMTLSLSLPKADANWLDAFSLSLFDMADYYGIQLIGGDTTTAPLKVLSLTVHGLLPKGQALRRTGAQVGDWLYVSGTLGDAALALHSLTQTSSQRVVSDAWAIEHHYHTQPRVRLGQILRHHASSCTDISDGLMTDAAQLMMASGVGALITLEQLPLSTVMQQKMPMQQALEYALYGGEDYELLFTIPVHRKSILESAVKDLRVPVTCIGQVKRQPDVAYRWQGQPWEAQSDAVFQHFTS